MTSLLSRIYAFTKEEKTWTWSILAIYHPNCTRRNGTHFYFRTLDHGNLEHHNYFHIYFLNSKKIKVFILKPKTRHHNRLSRSTMATTRSRGKQHRNPNCEITTEHSSLYMQESLFASNLSSFTLIRNRICNDCQKIRRKKPKKEST